MKNILMLVSAIFVCSSAYAADIPTQFRGAWGDDLETCRPNSVKANNQVIIDGKKLTDYETGCKLKKIKTATNVLFDGVFKCNSEGEDYDNPVKLQLVNDGNTLLFGERKLMRCK